MVQANLASHDLQLSDCVNINIFLSSIELFGRVNAVYSKFFGASPPARACVAVDLPMSCRVRLDCVALEEHAPMDRQALHVQALSYWAPANIGPYSQAIRVGICLLQVGPFTQLSSGQGTHFYIGPNRAYSGSALPAIPSLSCNRNGSFLPACPTSNRRTEEQLWRRLGWVHATRNILAPGHS